MAHALGKQLHEVMSWRPRMTHRQFQSWHAWLTLNDKEPTTDQWYMMQLTQEVFRLNFILNETRPDLKPSQFKLEFVKDKSSKGKDAPVKQSVVAAEHPVGMDDKEAASRTAAAIWGARLNSTRRSAQPPKKGRRSDG